MHNHPLQLCCMLFGGITEIDVTLVAWCFFFPLKKFEIYIFVLSKKSLDTFFVLLMLVLFVKFMAFNRLEFYLPSLILFSFYCFSLFPFLHFLPKFLKAKHSHNSYKIKHQNYSSNTNKQPSHLFPLHPIPKY